MNSGGNRGGASASAATGSNSLARRPSFNLKLRRSLRSKKARQQMADRACSDLALEGERLCREGHWEEGIQKLESATRTGIADSKTLSALYSQLGNAYFYLEDHGKALEYHKQDLTIARAMRDKLGEAKACGNIGSVLKALGQFDEAIACCRMQVDLAREIADKVLESRALYNLGNVYHARGKHASVYTTGFSQHQVEDFVRASLEQATRHYEANLKLVRELGDMQAQGRTVGNLGNTHYLLGNYKKAIKFHEERLSIADGLRDLAARRRAYSNLGNAHVFLGKYSSAAHYYLKGMEASRDMTDVAFEAQACYSLGNTYTLMQNYHKAIEYHQLHLSFAIQLQDRIGEARAYWSLGNAFTALGEHRRALHFAEQHLAMAVELGDEEGEVTARQNLSDLSSALELSDKFECPSPSPKLSSASVGSFTSFTSASVGHKRRAREKASYRFEMPFSKAQSPDSPQSEFVESPDSSVIDGASSCDISPLMHSHRDDDFPTEDSFLDMLSKFQGRRMDDQRTTLPKSLSPENKGAESIADDDDFIDVLWRLQSSRIEDQRCSMATAPHLMPAGEGEEEEVPDCQTTDELFDLIFRCQSSRINDQRCPEPNVCRKSTMPSEDFFNLIQHLQSTRIEDQRTPFPLVAAN